MARVWGVPRVLTWWSVTRSGFRLGGLLVVAAARYGPLTGERNFVGMANVDATPTSFKRQVGRFPDTP